MAVVKAALRSVHDEEKIRNDVSSFYLVWEISRMQNAMTTMIDPEEWSVFQTMTQQTFISVLLELAQNVKLKKYKNITGARKRRLRLVCRTEKTTMFQRQGFCGQKRGHLERTGAEPQTAGLGKGYGRRVQMLNPSPHQIRQPHRPSRLQ